MIFFFFPNQTLRRFCRAVLPSARTVSNKLGELSRVVRIAVPETKVYVTRDSGGILPLVTKQVYLHIPHRVTIGRKAIRGRPDRDN